MQPPRGGVLRLGWSTGEADGVTAGPGEPSPGTGGRGCGPGPQRTNCWWWWSRLTVDPGLRRRLATLIAIPSGKGRECGGILPEAPTRKLPSRIVFTEHRAGAGAPGDPLPELRPASSPSKNPYGSCPVHRLRRHPGSTMWTSSSQTRTSMEEGAVDPWEKPRYVKEPGPAPLLRPLPWGRPPGPLGRFPEEPATRHHPRPQRGSRGIPFLVSRSRSTAHPGLPEQFTRAPPPAPMRWHQTPPESELVGKGGRAPPYAAMSEVPVEELLP